jgi:hypothetical protein
MKNCGTIGLAAVAGLAHVAAAQHVATYQVRFGNNASVVTLVPGQSTTVSVRVSIEPGIGAPVTTGPLSGTVIGINDGAFNLSADAPAGVTGAWSNRVLQSPYNWLVPINTTPGTVVGLGVNGVYWGMGFLFSPSHPVPTNTVTIWTGTFTASPSSGFGVLHLSPDALLPTGVNATDGTPNIPFAAYYDAVGVPGTINVMCYPDCDLSGILTIADFACFQTRFVAGDLYADCNGTGTLNIADFGCFQTQFTAGCP